MQKKLLLIKIIVYVYVRYRSQIALKVYSSYFDPSRDFTCFYNIRIRLTQPDIWNKAIS